MPIRIDQLAAGDEIQCWMRLGLALKPAITGKGEPYFRVPVKPSSVGPGDLTRFIGLVMLNEPDMRVITVHVNSFNSWKQNTQREPRRATVAYSALQRVRRYSVISYEPTKYVPGTLSGRGYKSPGSIHPSTHRRPFRTLEEVTL